MNMRKIREWWRVEFESLVLVTGHSRVRWLRWLHRPLWWIDERTYGRKVAAYERRVRGEGDELRLDADRFITYPFKALGIHGAEISETKRTLVIDTTKRCTRTWEKDTFTGRCGHPVVVGNNLCLIHIDASVTTVPRR
jgi:hypothetical protein